MDGATLHSWWTVVMLIVFVAIVIWAWSGRRAADFEAAARIPLEDDDGPVASGREENGRG